MKHSVVRPCAEPNRRPRCSGLMDQPRKGSQGAMTSRRILSFTSIDDVLADVSQLAKAESHGRLQACGNWSLAECCQHIGKLVEFSLDGFPFRYPWHLRLVSRFLRFISWKLLVRLSLRPGFSNSEVASSLEPDIGISTLDGAAFLQQQFDRVQSGEQMSQ